VWKNYSYYYIYNRQFSEEECRNIISLHDEQNMVRSKISNVRDSDIFWIPRNGNTNWIFARLWNVAALYNYQYGFELSEELGQVQLTRYSPGQHYDWHMDLGPGQSSLRKITVVVELTARMEVEGGGIEVFYGDAVDNRVNLDAGDIAIFPSFVMHRAATVRSGTRWSLVQWLVGEKPLR
jgi:Rps23 Pro-64 3,4-dihydroxylase Tpa1-like proline 4-hydroxylase